MRGWSANRRPSLSRLEILADGLQFRTAFRACFRIAHIEPLAARNFGMHPCDQNLFVIGAVENTDPPALRQIAGCTPEEIVLQFFRARMLEAEHLTALRLTPDITSLMAPSFPAASIAWKLSRTA